MPVVRPMVSPQFQPCGMAAPAVLPTAEMNFW